MRRILDVTKVALSSDLNEARAPENFALPACMVSMLEALGDDMGVETLGAHDRKFLLRVGNQELLSASGMAFGLLFSDEMCPSAFDLAQVTPIGETLRRAFLWAGRDYSIISNDGSADSSVAMARITASIDAGVPVLAFGLMGLPECALVAGYEDGALVGWSHFQKFLGAQTIENGMFILPDWQEDWWMFIIPGGRVVKSMTIDDVCTHGLDIMRQTETEGYRAGQAAYDAWKRMLQSASVADDEKKQEIYAYHHSLTFSLAELRCWGGAFLQRHGRSVSGTLFKEIHDLCWALSASAGSNEKWRALEKPDRLIEILDDIRDKDIAAMRALAEGR